MRIVGKFALKNLELYGGFVKDGAFLYAKLPYTDDIDARVDLARNSLEGGSLSFIFEINERKPPIHDVTSFLNALGLCYLAENGNTGSTSEAVNMLLSFDPELREYDSKKGDDLASILAHKFNIWDVKTASNGKIIEKKIKTRDYGFVPAYTIIAKSD